VRLIQLLFAYSKSTAILALIAGLVAGLSNAAILAVINQVLTTRQSDLITLPTPAPGLIGSFIGLCLLLLVTATASQYSLAKLSQTIVYQLILRLTRSILDTSFQHLESVGAPKLMAVLTKDVEAISSASAVISGLCINLSLLLGCLIYLAWLSPPAFLVLVGFLVFGMYATNILLTQGRQALRIAREDQDRLFKDFEAMTLGVKELKLHFFRRQSYYQNELTPNAANYRDRWVYAMFFFSLAGGIGLILFFVPLGFLLFLMPRFWDLSPSLVGSLVLVIIFMLTPLRGILLGLPQLSIANISLQKVESLGLSLSNYIPAQSSNPQAQSHWQRIDFQDIVHTYHTLDADHEFTLGPLSLSLFPGEIVFIVGGNGSGKSTFLKLLTGLYTPERGQVILNGDVLEDRNREDYRQLFSAIFADFYLFDRLLGLELDNLDQQAQHYLRQLELDQKVTVSGGKLSTTSLSQGQRKRLALLTAYLENRPIYVFDEWASDQDPVFKDVFYCQLLPALRRQGKTAVVISHDDQYFETGDRLIKLAHGKIIKS
jgi:putative pyoverdin transport system ATP-binding/permease protein